MSRTSPAPGSLLCTSREGRAGTFARPTGTTREEAGGGGSRLGKRRRSPAGSRKRSACRICARGHLPKLETAGKVPIDDDGSGGGGRAESCASSWSAHLPERQSEGKQRRAHRRRGRSAGDVIGSSAKRQRVRRRYSPISHDWASVCMDLQLGG